MKRSQYYEIIGCLVDDNKSQLADVLAAQLKRPQVKIGDKVKSGKGSLEGVVTDIAPSKDILIKLTKVNVNNGMKVGSIIHVSRDSFIPNDKGLNWVVATTLHLRDVKVNNRIYKAFLFNNENDANNFMEKNKEWGVIKNEGSKVWVAKKSDKGMPAK